MAKKIQPHSAGAGAIEVRISATNERGEYELTAAELGVVLTAINRSINYAVLPASVQSRNHFNPQGKEPSAVRLKIVNVNNGSVVLQMLGELISTAKPAFDDGSTQFLLSAYFTLVWDPEKSKTLVDNIRKGLRRVVEAAYRKTIEIIFTVGGKSRKLTATVSNKGAIKIISEDYVI